MNPDNSAQQPTTKWQGQPPSDTAAEGNEAAVPLPAPGTPGAPIYYANTPEELQNTLTALENMPNRPAKVIVLVKGKDGKLGEMPADRLGKARNKGKKKGTSQRPTAHMARTPPTNFSIGGLTPAGMPLMACPSVPHCVVIRGPAASAIIVQIDAMNEKGEIPASSAPIARAPALPTPGALVLVAGVPTFVPTSLYNRPPTDPTRYALPAGASRGIMTRVLAGVAAYVPDHGPTHLFHKLDPKKPEARDSIGTSLCISGYVTLNQETGLPEFTRIPTLSHPPFCPLGASLGVIAKHRENNCLYFVPTEGRTVGPALQSKGAPITRKSPLGTLLGIVTKDESGLVRFEKEDNARGTAIGYVVAGAHGCPLFVSEMRAMVSENGTFLGLPDDEPLSIGGNTTFNVAATSSRATPSKSGGVSTATTPGKANQLATPAKPGQQPSSHSGHQPSSDDDSAQGVVGAKGAPGTAGAKGAAGAAGTQGAAGAAGAKGPPGASGVTGAQGAPGAAGAQGAANGADGKPSNNSEYNKWANERSVAFRSGMGAYPAGQPVTPNKAGQAVLAGQGGAPAGTNNTEGKGGAPGHASDALGGAAAESAPDPWANWKYKPMTRVYKNGQTVITTYGGKEIAKPTEAENKAKIQETEKQTQAAEKEIAEVNKKAEAEEKNKMKEAAERHRKEDDEYQKYLMERSVVFNPLAGYGAYIPK